MTPPPPRSPLFPYTTLFRSGRPGLLIVKPGDPDASYLVRKIEGTRGISGLQMPQGCPGTPSGGAVCPTRSEEHTSELQSLRHLVCRLLLAKKKHTRDPTRDQ